MAILMPMAAGAQEPYAVLSDDNTVLTFYYDDQKAERNGMDVGPFSGEPDYSSWYGQSQSITSVVFDVSFAGCTTLTSTAYWFYELRRLSSITGISNLKTDNVTNMSNMFRNCFSLTSLDVTGFKTDNVTDMSFLFSGCSGLTSLDLTGLKTDNVTDMNYMFWDCSGLTSLDVTGFKTDNVTDMSRMFFGCSGLTSLDLTGFNTDNVTDMGGMFCGCSGLTSLNLTGFKTDNVTDMSVMFFGCSSLTSLDVTGFKTDNVFTLFSMFGGCSSLTSLNLTGFKTDNVTFMDRVFYNCSGLTTIYAGDGWSTAKVTAGQDLFLGCTNLVGGAGTKYNASHRDYTYARIDGGSENPGYFTAKTEGSGESHEGGSGQWKEGDLNHDGKLDAADIVVLVNLIMNQK